MHSIRQEQLDNFLAAIDCDYDIEVYIDMANIFVNSGCGGPITSGSYIVFSHPHGSEIHTECEAVASFIEDRGFIVSRVNYRPRREPQA